MTTTPNPKRNVSEADIKALRDLLSNTQAKVLIPSDEEYAISIERWSRAAEKPAGVSIVPTTAAEVGIALRYANDHSIDVAIKGGGHSTAGASSTNGGLLIDMRSGMHSVAVDTDKQRLHVQGGAIWGDVDAAAWQHGLATVGGTVADTGVGGLTLGGGYGVLSGQRGLVIDNMVSATVVLASGEVKQASDSENADLFWALRGAGQNFGVTTEFVLQAYPQGDLFMGMMVFAPSKENVAKLVVAINELHGIQETADGPKTKAGGRTMTLIGVVKPPAAGGQTMILVLVSCDTDEAIGRELYKDFLEIGPVVNTLDKGPYPKVNQQVPSTSGMRSSMKGAAFVLPLREEFVHSILATYEEFTASCGDAQESLVAWELYDPCVVAKCDNGCFASRGLHLNSVIMPTWTKEENDQHCRQWARDVSNMFKKEIEAHGETASEGIEGGASVRGKKGAVLLYGNYDVSGG
jgi:FAD/FMN-containing dehydrogenase